MTTKRPAPPERSPAGPARAGSSARKTAAKKTTAKKTTAKKTIVRKTAAKTSAAKKKAAKRQVRKTPTRPAAAPTAAEPAAAAPLSPRDYRQQAERTRAAADKRKATLAAKAADPGGSDPPAKPTKTRNTHRLPRSAVHRLDDPPPASGQALIERVGSLIEQELTLVEQVVSGNRVDKHLRTEAERRARTLASLTKTLTELHKLRSEETSKAADDDAVPRDLDEFRRVLSRRLEQLVTPAEEFSAARDE